MLSPLVMRGEVPNSIAGDFSPLFLGQSQLRSGWRQLAATSWGLLLSVGHGWLRLARTLASRKEGVGVRKSLLVIGSVVTVGLYALLWLTWAPTPAQAGAAKPVPVIGSIPEEFLKGTMPPPKFSGEIRLGALYPRSGSNSYLGEEAWRGVELAMRVQNAKGGINGKEIKITIADAPDIQVGVSEVERLISKEGLKVIMGTFTSGVAYATTAVAERNNVLYFETNGTADNITQRGLKYTFRAGSRMSSTAASDVDMLKNILAPMLKIPVNQLKVAVMNEDSQWGTESGKYAEQFSKEAGFQVVLHEAYSAKAVDLSSLVLKLKSAAPDVVIAASYIPDANLFWKQCRELDYMPKALVGMGSGHTARDFYTAFGKDANGVFSGDFPQFDQNPQAAPGITEYMQLYRATYKEEMRGPQSLVAFSSASLLWHVLAKTNSLEPDVLRKALLEIDLPLHSAPIGWGYKFAAPGDPNMGTNLRTYTAVMQWQDGKFVTVYPTEAAAGPIKYIPLQKWSERK